MSPLRPLRKDFADLKRPELQGVFVCGTCNQQFAHAASLNRHRINQHSVGQTCLQCSHTLGPSENMRDHMQKHNITRIFTCHCCNWSFANKKELGAHCVAIRDFGVPRHGTPIAISVYAPGSLTQEAVTGITPTRKRMSVLKRQSSMPNSETSSTSSSRPSSPPLHSWSETCQKTLTVDEVIEMVQKTKSPDETIDPITLLTIIHAAQGLSKWEREGTPPCADDFPVKNIKIKERPRTVDEKRAHLGQIVNRLTERASII